MNDDQFSLPSTSSPFLHLPGDSFLFLFSLLHNLGLNNGPVTAERGLKLMLLYYYLNEINTGQRPRHSRKGIDFELKIKNEELRMGNVGTVSMVI